MSSLTIEVPEEKIPQDILDEMTIQRLPQPCEEDNQSKYVEVSKLQKIRHIKDQHIREVMITMLAMADQLDGGFRIHQYLNHCDRALEVEIIKLRRENKQFRKSLKWVILANRFAPWAIGLLAAAALTEVGIEIVKFVTGKW